MKPKLKLRKEVKKVLITLGIFIFNMLLYHYLKKFGGCAGENNLMDSFLVVGWVWLTIGSTISLILCWDVE